MLLQRYITAFVLTILTATSSAQIVSHFNWNSNPVLNAVVGPNAISAGATATSSPGGVGGTNGLNPGAPSPASDINLRIPNTGNVFDLSNVDISIDYRRNESTAQLIKRSTFTFNTGGSSANFRVTYRVVNSPGFTTVTSTNVAIPQDNTFRTYRFTYDNCSGVGTMYVNNTVVWTSPTATPNQNLYWVSDGDVFIGQDMDGTNNNIPNLDNFIWQGFTCTPLPIELLSFTGHSEGQRNYLKWSTATEKNNDYFTVERSTDGEAWTSVARVYGSGNSSSLRSYSAYDPAPEKTLNYYRLRQTDRDGTEKKYSIITIDNSERPDAPKVIKITDLLGRDVNNSEGVRFLHYSDGTVIKQTISN